MESVLGWSFLMTVDDEKRLDVVADADAQLMLRFQAGDRDAFEILFSRHIRALMNFAFRFVRNREIAEELAQEVFLKVNDAAPSYRPEAKFTTWLYRIATNVCLNEIRRPTFRIRHQSLESGLCGGEEYAATDPVDSGTASPDKMLQRRAVAEALRRALGNLPEKQRLAFILNKYQELSYAEVAEVMKTSEKAVKSLIHRAKEAMAERLKPLLPELL
jgi:RNA polymerase sigma-70 factor, ECF subfamily